MWRSICQEEFSPLSPLQGQSSRRSLDRSHRWHTSDSLSSVWRKVVCSLKKKILIKNKTFILKGLPVKVHTTAYGINISERMLILSHTLLYVRGTLRIHGVCSKYADIICRLCSFMCRRQLIFRTCSKFFSV